MAAASAYPSLQATHSAPSNIACIKYWGKRDVRANTPINSSVSVTMNQDDLKAITTVTASKDFDKDQLWLNGRYVPGGREGRGDASLRCRAVASPRCGHERSGQQAVRP
jgi:mevalonate pyrophosphate decarboxylase